MQSRFPGLDRFDQAILRELSHNGRSSVSDLARAIGLSKSPTQARLKRLETEGIIQGYRAMIDPIRLGLDHVAFVEVKLTDTREAALASFNAAVVQVAEIEEVHMLASHFDYLLKVRCRSMSDFRAAACFFHFDLHVDASGKGRRGPRADLTRKCDLPAVA